LLHATQVVARYLGAIVSNPTAESLLVGSLDKVRWLKGAGCCRRWRAYLPAPIEKGIIVGGLWSLVNIVNFLNDEFIFLSVK
jgi:hypothetical protein